jgi:hypothetical protein
MRSVHYRHALVKLHDNAATNDRVMPHPNDSPQEKERKKGCQLLLSAFHIFLQTRL